MSRTSSPEPTPGRWMALRLEVPGSSADELAGALGAGSLGVETAELAGGRAALAIYFKDPSEATGG